MTVCPASVSGKGAERHQYDLPEVTFFRFLLAANGVRCQAIGMNLQRRLTDLFSPLTLAAVVAWLAVWFSMGGLWQRDPQAAWWAHGAAAAFLMVFIGEHLISHRLGMRGFTAVCIVLALLALIPIALSPNGAGSILLVLWAAMVAARFEGSALWLWLGIANVAVALIMWAFWPASKFLWITWMAYVSFQAFAAMVMRYAMQSERLSERLQKANGELASINAELLGTRSLLDASVRDSERLRISRELHDVAGHKLTALKLNLNALQRHPAFSGSEELGVAADLSDELLQDIRAVVQQLRLHDAPPLRDALSALASPFPQLRLMLELDESAVRMPITEAEAVLRCVQEALTNAAKHGNAGALSVRLQQQDAQWCLDIHDDGTSVPEPRAGNGLRGMRERIENLGGSLQWQCTSGMPLTARWPVRE
jgi:signal transduction histidine kinase